ncbi:hypothetical protein NQ318_010053 [Aromia moschata]|uniref:Uncharacterized protein n=1 Tax=Aromia moschata TaxID=1265417 RepID=A0AAV8YE80_9CUCU|nr:hypothetical protein NQ318_010053 [Aromia moschata]
MPYGISSIVFKNKVSKQVEIENPNNIGYLITEEDRLFIKSVKVENRDSEDKMYLHELLEGSEIILPKNEEIPRNEELERRCQRLKAEQQNRDYFQMTKNVDRVRKKLPEDTFGLSR